MGGGVVRRRKSLALLSILGCEIDISKGGEFLFVFSMKRTSEEDFVVRVPPAFSSGVVLVFVIYYWPSEKVGVWGQLQL